MIRDWVEEFDLALKNKRVPKCINCGKNLTLVARGDMMWVWNNKMKKYIKEKGGYREDDKPYCWKCGGYDWEIVGEFDSAIKMGLK